MSNRGQRIIAEMRRIANARPKDYAEQCHYIDRDAAEPCGDCIVGQALWNLGLIEANLPGNGITVEGWINRSETNDDNEDIWAPLSFEEKFWIMIVQQVQDGRHESNSIGQRPETRYWSVGVMLADHELAELQARNANFEKIVSEAR